MLGVVAETGLCELTVPLVLVRPFVAGIHDRVGGFKRILKAAKLPLTTRFHDLRHSCATILLAQGVPLKTVSDLLGHSSIRTTADIYGYTDDNQKRDAAERIAGLFDCKDEDKDGDEETGT